MSDLAESLRTVANQLASELEIRTCAVIVTDNGQALACSASVAAAYGTVREERDQLQKTLLNTIAMLNEEKKDEA